MGFLSGGVGPPHVTITTFRRDGYVSTEKRTRIGSSRAVHTYDAAGRLTEIEWWHDGGFRTKTLNSYDHSGRPIETVQVSEDGSRHQSETLSYDDAGRKTRLQYLPAGFEAYTVDETERSYTVPGAATSTTLYDDHNRATEVLVHNASHVLLHHVMLTRDDDGRLLREDVWLGGAGRFPALAEKIENLAPMREQRTRFDYGYDPWGNWTERVTSMRIDAEKAFQRTAMDRRINTYLLAILRVRTFLGC